ncbi:hypothetical protein [Rubinisphaera sp.]|nr:hypothetical protein [Rubinisphaera sp.]
MNQPEFDNLIDEVLRLPDVQRTILRDRINETLDHFQMVSAVA